MTLHGIIIIPSSCTVSRVLSRYPMLHLTRIFCEVATSRRMHGIFGELERSNMAEIYLAVSQEEKLELSSSASSVVSDPSLSLGKAHGDRD